MCSTHFCQVGDFTPFMIFIYIFIACFEKIELILPKNNLEITLVGTLPGFKSLFSINRVDDVFIFGTQFLYQAI